MIFKSRNETVHCSFCYLIQIPFGKLSSLTEKLVSEIKKERTQSIVRINMELRRKHHGTRFTVTLGNYRKGRWTLQPTFLWRGSFLLVLRLKLTLVFKIRFYILCQILHCAGKLIFFCAGEQWKQNNLSWKFRLSWRGTSPQIYWRQCWMAWIWSN